MNLSEVLREFKAGVEQIYGPRLSAIVLFGSRARNDAEEDSDIDIMIVLHGPVNSSEETDRLSAFTSGVCLKHDVVICCVYVSEEDFRNRHSPLLLNVRREGVRV